MIASEFTDWNQAFGNTKPPGPKMSRSTILSARKVKELPACSKNIQNRMLKTKMISIAIALSRCTLPSRIPSISSSVHRMRNIGSSTYQFSAAAPIDSRKYTAGIASQRADEDVQHLLLAAVAFRRATDAGELAATEPEPHQAQQHADARGDEHDLVGRHRLRAEHLVGQDAGEDRREKTRRG